MTTHPCYPYLHYPILLCWQDTPGYSLLSWKSSTAYCFGGSSYLFALWLTPCVQVFFTDIPCPCHTDVMEIIMCANAPYHPLIPMKSFFWLRRHSDLSWNSVNQTFIDCPCKSVQLIYPWSEHLLLIPPILEIRILLNLSVELFGCSY